MPKGLTLRKIQRTGNSLTVALTPSAIRVLRARIGRPVQVVITRRGTVEIAPASRRVNVKQEYVDLVAELEQSRRDGERLRSKLGGRPMRIHRAGFAQGFAHAQSARLLDLDALLRDVRELVTLLQAVAAAPLPPPPAPVPGSTDS